jgi:hypothetical protein
VGLVEVLPEGLKVVAVHTHCLSFLQENKKARMAILTTNLIFFIYYLKQKGKNFKLLKAKLVPNQIKEHKKSRSLMNGFFIIVYN